MFKRLNDQSPIPNDPAKTCMQQQPVRSSQFQLKTLENKSFSKVYFCLNYFNNLSCQEMRQELLIKLEIWSRHETFVGNVLVRR